MRKARPREGRCRVWGWLVREAGTTPSLPVSSLGTLLLCQTRLSVTKKRWSKAKQKHFLFGPSQMTAPLWPLPVATLSQLQRLRLSFVFSYRFVITRPANEFKLLPSDLVFCAIPFNMSYYEKDNSLYQGPYENINKESQTSETSAVISYLPSDDPVGQRSTQSSNTSVHLLEPKTSPIGNPERPFLSQSGKLSPQIYPGKENVKKPSEGTSSAYSN